MDPQLLHLSEKIHFFLLFFLVELHPVLLSLQQGLKTGMYYLRTRPAADPIKFTLDKQKMKQNAAAKEAAESTKAANEAAMMCSLENKEACLSCSGWGDSICKDGQLLSHPLTSKNWQTQWLNKYVGSKGESLECNGRVVFYHLLLSRISFENYNIFQHYFRILVFIQVVVDTKFGVEPSKVCQKRLWLTVMANFNLNWTKVILLSESNI